MKKITITTENIGKFCNDPVEKMREKTAKQLTNKIDLFVKAQIKDKPKWFPSQKLWERLACKFLQINNYK
jgi:hypothetical protein